MKRTNEAIERDLAALIKHGNDLRRDSAELNRTAKELLRKTARLKGVLAKSAWMGRIKQSRESEGRDDRRILLHAEPHAGAAAAAGTRNLSRGCSGTRATRTIGFGVPSVATCSRLPDGRRYSGPCWALKKSSGWLD